MRELLTDWLSAERLEALLERAQLCRVGVIGDLALDGYWTADMTRSLLSRETPRFPRPIVRERYAPGAGGNVAQNLTALGLAQVDVFSVLGRDWRGDIMRRELSARSITVDHLILSARRSTSTYIKPLLTGYESQQEDARLDFENPDPLAPDLEEALITQVTSAIEALDALIVADQFEVNGVITDRVREVLIALAAAHPASTFVVDSRQRIERFTTMVLKPNWSEAMRAAGRRARSGDGAPTFDEIAEVARALAERAGRPVCVTLGAAGALVWDGGPAYVPAAPVRPPLDPVGAGDTFVAALTTGLACGATPAEAAALANLAAAVTVEKIGETGTATPDEIRARYALTEAAR
ncbi:MAG: sugar kinase [Anaerolineae bacterium]|nr:sugar kinase [Anaerolineae bacterium]